MSEPKKVSEEYVEALLEVEYPDWDTVPQPLKEVRGKIEDLERQVKVSRSNQRIAEQELSDQCKDLRDALDRADKAEAKNQQLKQYESLANENPWSYWHHRAEDAESRLKAAKDMVQALRDDNHNVTNKKLDEVLKALGGENDEDSGWVEVPKGTPIGNDETFRIEATHHTNLETLETTQRDFHLYKRKKKALSGEESAKAVKKQEENSRE